MSPSAEEEKKKKKKEEKRAKKKLVRLIFDMQLRTLPSEEVYPLSERPMKVGICKRRRASRSSSYC